MKTFWFDGESAAAHGLIVSGSGTFNSAERDVERFSIPGRNGDLTVDNGRYKNVPVTYPASICTDFAANAEKSREWLGSKTGYCRLEDDYDPDHFRMARFQGPLEFTPGFLNRTAECTIRFDCKPQRFLKSGESEIEIYPANRWIQNPTRFPAQPLLIVTCTAAVAKIQLWSVDEEEAEAGSFTVDTTSIAEQVTLYMDSETGEVYRYAFGNFKSAANNLGTIPFGKAILSTSAMGCTVKTEQGSVDSVRIVPRWWTL